MMTGVGAGIVSKSREDGNFVAITCEPDLRSTGPALQTHSINGSNFLYNPKFYACDYVASLFGQVVMRMTHRLRLFRIKCSPAGSRPGAYGRSVISFEINKRQLQRNSKSRDLRRSLPCFFSLLLSVFLVLKIRKEFTSNTSRLPVR